tara:strand:+ start:67 stop:450 length:384 start_codon:yes stop_codon:yes gene_type:complete
MIAASMNNCSATKQFAESRLGPVSTGPTKDGRFDNQLRAPGHVDQSTKEEFSMDKRSDDRARAMTGYIRSREKRDGLKNVFFEPVGNTNSSREQIMFNLVTALIDNGFEPDEKVERWYAEQVKLLTE